MFLLGRIPGWADISLWTLKHHERGCVSLQIRNLTVRFSKVSAKHVTFRKSLETERQHVGDKARLTAGDKRSERMISHSVVQNFDAIFAKGWRSVHLTTYIKNAPRLLLGRLPTDSFVREPIVPASSTKQRLAINRFLACRTDKEDDDRVRGSRCGNLALNAE